MSTPRRFKFTHRLIDGLPPNEPDAPSREAEYSDTEISGLKCLVGKGEGKKKFLTLSLAGPQTRHQYWSLAGD